jgi:hypothetical protein
VHKETGSQIRQIGFDSAAAELEGDEEDAMKASECKRKLGAVMLESLDERETALRKKVLDFR